MDRRAAAGQTEAVEPLEEGAEPAASNVVDLTELLKRSVGARKSAGGDKAQPARKTAEKATASRKTAARRRA